MFPNQEGITYIYFEPSTYLVYNIYKHLTGNNTPIIWHRNILFKKSFLPGQMHLIRRDPSMAEYLVRHKELRQDINVFHFKYRLNLGPPQLEGSAPSWLCLQPSTGELHQVIHLSRPQEVPFQFANTHHYRLTDGGT